MLNDSLERRLWVAGHRPAPPCNKMVGANQDYAVFVHAPDPDPVTVRIHIVAAIPN